MFSFLFVWINGKRFLTLNKSTLITHVSHQGVSQKCNMIQEDDVLVKVINCL